MFTTLNGHRGSARPIIIPQFFFFFFRKISLSPNIFLIWKTKQFPTPSCTKKTINGKTREHEWWSCCPWEGESRLQFFPVTWCLCDVSWQIPMCNGLKLAHTELQWVRREQNSLQNSFHFFDDNTNVTPSCHSPWLAATCWFPWSVATCVITSLIPRESIQIYETCSSCSKVFDPFIFLKSLSRFWFCLWFLTEVLGSLLVTRFVFRQRHLFVSSHLHVFDSSLYCANIFLQFSVEVVHLFCQVLHMSLENKKPMSHADMFVRATMMKPESVSDVKHTLTILPFLQQWVVSWEQHCVENQSVWIPCIHCRLNICTWGNKTPKTFHAPCRLFQTWD